VKRNTPQKISLPVSNPAEDMETISRNKLSLLFDPSLFEVRQELQRDKGIDLVIELKQDNTYTNFRFVIQLKSTASAKVKKDQTISYPVDVANINYLLNYGMPAYYILYDHTGATFYIEPAHKVFQALIKKHHPEKHPKQFKITFSKTLTTETIKETYQETLENGLLLRRLNAHLNLPTVNTKQAGILIDDDNEVYSVEQNIEFVERYGLMLLNRSEFKRIVEIEQRTHPRTTASPIFNLVCGVAYFQQASLFKAIEFLKSAHNSAASFEPAIKSMLVYTYLQAKHLLGMMSEADFKKDISELMQTEQLGSFLELEKVYTLFTEDNEATETKIKTLHNKISTLISDDPDNTHLRIRAYSIILNIEEKQLLHNLPLNFVMLCGRIPNLKATKTYKKWKELDDLHSGRQRSVLKYCLDTHNFLAASNIAMDISEWNYQKLFIFFVLTNWDSQTLAVKGELSTEELSSLAEESKKIDKVIEGYEMLEHRENMIQALSFKYELLSFFGNKTDAEATLAYIKSLIEKYDLNALIAKYQSLIHGSSRYNKFRTYFTEHMNKIYRVAENSGIGQYFTQPIPVEYLTQTEFLDKEKKWMDREFFEFDFPAVDMSQTDKS
jgi:hypothetical protein